MYSRHPSKDSQKDSFFFSFLSHAFFESCNSPINVAQIRLQCDSELLKSAKTSSLYSRPITCFSRIFKEEGWKAFFKGNFTNIIKFFPSQLANYYAAFTMFRFFQSNSSDDGKFTRAIKGAITSTGVAICTTAMDYSLEFVKTRLINDIGKKQYKGIIDVYQQTLKSDGIKGLYRGFATTIMGILVYRAGYFGLYGLSMSVLNVTDFMTHFMIAFMCTIMVGLCSYPLDTIRRRVMMTCGSGVKYEGAWTYMRNAVQKEGMRPLYNGAGLVVLMGIVKTLGMTFFDMSRSKQ